MIDWRDFHVIFSLFRFAVIFIGIADRARAGMHGNRTLACPIGWSGFSMTCATTAEVGLCKVDSPLLLYEVYELDELTVGGYIRGKGD